MNKNDFVLNREIKLNSNFRVAFDEFWSDNTHDGGRYMTVCVVRIEKTDMIFSGCTVLHPSDEFDRKKAYKKSFERALSAMLPHSTVLGFSDEIHKELRGELWKMFLPYLNQL